MKHKVFDAIFTIVLVIALGLLVWLLFDVHALYRAGALRPTGWRAGRREELMQNLSFADWMTFNYINHVFNVPPDYLQKTLAISDTRYPELTVGEYLKTSTTTDAEFLPKLQAAVKSYLHSSGQ